MVLKLSLDLGHVTPKLKPKPTLGLYLNHVTIKVGLNLSHVAPSCER
jgi:hypothetical protein